MLYSVILQKIVARKVSSYVALRNCSKVIRVEKELYGGARVHNVISWEKKNFFFKKFQKITAYDKNDSSQINDFHAFKQSLFIYFYNLIYLFAYFSCTGSLLLTECSLFWLW